MNTLLLTLVCTKRGGKTLHCDTRTDCTAVHQEDCYYHCTEYFLGSGLLKLNYAGSTGITFTLEKSTWQWATTVLLLWLLYQCRESVVKLWKKVSLLLKIACLSWWVGWKRQKWDWITKRNSVQRPNSHVCTAAYAKQTQSCLQPCSTYNTSRYLHCNYFRGTRSPTLF